MRRLVTLVGTLPNYYLGSDTSTGGWTPSAGGTLYGTLDETTPSDADYDQSAINPNSDAMECRFADVQVPAAGHLTFSYRIKGTGTCNISVSLLYGTGSITFSHSPAPTTWTQYDQDIDPAAISDWSNISLRVIATAA